MKGAKLVPVEGVYCMALHGNHDEHQCAKKPGHMGARDTDGEHECYCGVWW